MKALKARWDKMKKRDKYISIAIFSLTWYTVASLIMTALGVPPPDVLTERWFKALTSHIALLYGQQSLSLWQASRFSERTKRHYE